MAMTDRFLRSVHVDREFVPQERLDLVVKDRTSLYPWRGQFSPELVETLLSAYAGAGTTVLDPFAGSGTTLFEAARRGLACFGAEVNPAAVEFASMVRFCSIPSQRRSAIIKGTKDRIEEYLSDHLPRTLFREGSGREVRQPIGPERLRTLLQSARDDELVRSLLVTTIMLAMGDGDELLGAALDMAMTKNAATVSDLPFSQAACHVFMSDARRLPLQAASIGLVITSPPYINVFNYHQNYRPAMELLGWDLLGIARSEIGANRKHRGNRFMTVVQFCMDLALAFCEVRRVLSRDGRAVFVVGRESQVRGVPFSNGELLAYLAVQGCGLELERRQERKFTNRFGATIYEEVLTLRPGGETRESPEEFGRTVGKMALEHAFSAAKGETRDDITAALERSDEIRLSPLLTAARTTVPPVCA